MNLLLTLTIGLTCSQGSADSPATPTAAGDSHSECVSFFDVRQEEVVRCQQAIQRLEASNVSLEREIRLLEGRIKQVQDMIDAGLRRDPPMISPTLIALKARLEGQKTRWQQRMQSNLAEITRLKIRLVNLMGA